MERACVNPACDADVTFELGAGHAASDEPVRHTTTCDVCGCRQYLIPASGNNTEVHAALKK
jgi:hypothetical protein